MLLPILASALILFGSPYVGQIRGWLRSSFPDQYAWIIGGITTTAVVGAIVWAVTRVRQSRPEASANRPGAWPMWARYALVIAAVITGAAYARAVSSGEAEVDLVEAFHFVEYGVVAHLFYRSLRGRTDVSRVALAACAGLAVGIADESIQWFVPGRVGEMHDILINAVSIGCGLLFSVAVQPPVSLAWPTPRASRLAIGLAFSGLLVAFAGFVDRVHIGYDVQDDRTGVFRSRYSQPALEAAVVERPGRWKVSPPPRSGFHHEDHYLSEGEWHVQRRNIAVGTGEWGAALQEDAILERFFSPVLDLNGRWSPEQRSEFEAKAQGHERALYVSDAAPYPISVVSRPVFWTVTLLIAGAVMWLAWRV